MRKDSYMGKIISIDEINRAVMEGKDDLVFELCKVFDHESYFGQETMTIPGKASSLQAVILTALIHRLPDLVRLKLFRNFM